MASTNWPGKPNLKDRLYTYGAVALLIAMTWLMGLHIYQLVSPPTITIVLAAQPGGSKPQATLWYACGWSWSSSSAPAGSTVAFNGWCSYFMAGGPLFPSVYSFKVYIYDPFGPPANSAPYGIVNYPVDDTYKTYYVTLNYIVYNGQYAWYWGVGPISYTGNVFGPMTASINGYWTPNMPFTYKGCASASGSQGLNAGSPGCSSITIS